MLAYLTRTTIIWCSLNVFVIWSLYKEPEERSLAKSRTAEGSDFGPSRLLTGTVFVFLVLLLNAERNVNRRS